MNQIYNSMLDDRFITAKELIFFGFILMSISLGLTTSYFSLYTLSLPGVIIFFFFFFRKLKSVLLLILFVRPIVDILFTLKVVGSLKLSYLFGGSISLLLLLYLFLAKYDFFFLTINKIYTFFLFSSFISVLLSQDVFWGFTFWAKLVQNFLIFNIVIFVVSNSYKIDDKIIRLISWSIIFAVIVPLIFFIKNYSSDIYVVVGGYKRFDTLHSHTNIFSYLLLSVLPFCFFQYSVTGESKIKKLLLLVLIGIIGFAIYKTYTRNVWLALIAQLIAWNIFKKNLFIIFSLTGLILLVTIFNPTIKNRLYDLYRIFSGNNFFTLDYTLLSHRVGIWQANIQFFIDSTFSQKLFGNGFDIRVAVGRELPKVIGEHNNYLTLLMYGGVSVLVSYLLYIIWLFKEGFELLSCNNDIFIKNIACTFLSLLFSYVILSCATHIFWNITYQWYFSVFAGILVAANNHNKSRRRYLSA